MATHSAPSDNAVRSAARSAAQKRNARRMKKGGKSPIAGMGNVTRRVLSTRNGPKAAETDHLRSDQFSGRHHAPSSYASALKNAHGGDASVGRHSREVDRPSTIYKGKHSGPYTPQHASDHFNHIRDIIGHGGRPMGKHAKG